MTSTRRMHRAYFVDLLLGVGLALLLAVEALSLVSAVADVQGTPSGLVLDARDAAPGGIAVGPGVSLFDRARVSERGSHGGCRHAL